MKCNVMGIVNVTPDSFSDGGRYFEPEEAVRRAQNMVEEGADVIDIGGESTRPGSEPLAWQEEWERLEPVLKRLSVKVPVSVDTYHPETAEKAIECGARLINCVYADTAVEMARICSRRNSELIIPHRLGGYVPTQVVSIPDNLGEVLKALPTYRLYLDPMIGFGTTREEDIALLKSVPDMARAGRVLVGASRKRIVKKLTGEKLTGKNLGGNVGIAIWAALHGASIVRVHDVKETVQAMRVIDALD